MRRSLKKLKDYSAQVIQLVLELLVYYIFTITSLTNTFHNFIVAGILTQTFCHIPHHHIFHKIKLCS